MLKQHRTSVPPHVLWGQFLNLFSVLYEGRYLSAFLLESMQTKIMSVEMRTLPDFMNLCPLRLLPSPLQAITQTPLSLPLLMHNLMLCLLLAPPLSVVSFRPSRREGEGRGKDNFTCYEATKATRNWGTRRRRRSLLSPSPLFRGCKTHGKTRGRRRGQQCHARLSR